MPTVASSSTGDNVMRWSRFLCVRFRNCNERLAVDKSVEIWCRLLVVLGCVEDTCLFWSWVTVNTSPKSLGDGRHHVRAPPAAVEATKKARLHLQTLMPLPSEGTHRAEPGSPPSLGRVGGEGGGSLALSSPKLSRNLKCIPEAI